MQTVKDPTTGDTSTVADGFAAVLIKNGWEPAEAPAPGDPDGFTAAQADGDQPTDAPPSGDAATPTPEEG